MEDDLERRVANLLRFAMKRAFDDAPHLLEILDAMPVCISYVDTALVYRFANRNYESWFGRSRDDIVGKTVPEVLGDGAYAAIEHHIARALEGEPVQFQGHLDYKDAGPKHVMATFVPDRGTDGNVRGYFALVQETGDPAGPGGDQAARRRRLRIAD